MYPLFCILYTLSSVYYIISSSLPYLTHIPPPLPRSVHRDFLVACDERVARKWPKDYHLAREPVLTASPGTLAVGGRGGSAEKKRWGNELALVSEQPAQALVTRKLRVPKCTLKLKKERYERESNC